MLRPPGTTLVAAHRGSRESVMPSAALRPVRAPTVGFLEIAIGLLVLGAATSVAIPWWMSTRIRDNEQSAIATLAEIHAAQVAFRERSGGRTFGSLPELLGDGEDGRDVPVEPVLLELTQASRDDRTLTRAGYHFAVYLTEGGNEATQFATQEHPVFVAYAWPIAKGYSGHRIFAVGPDGVIWANDNDTTRYEGRSDPPDPAVSQRVTKTPFPRPPPGLLQLPWEPAQPARAEEPAPHPR